MEERRLLSTLFVTSTSGDPTVLGSLPFEVAHSADGDVVDFSQLGAGKHTITLTQNLEISTSITIDGSTGVGFSANTSIATDNANLTIQISGAGNFGIIFATSGITLQDLAVTHYGAVGVAVNAADGLIQGAFIGVDTDGSTTDGGTTGIKVDGAAATGTTIGGTSLAARALIGGNTGNGVWFTNAASGGLVAGSFIGLAADGSSGAANSGSGVLIDAAATKVSIGGSTGESPGNVISANGVDGVLIDNSSGNTVKSNIIGLDTSGHIIAGAVQVIGVNVQSEGSGSSTDNTIGGGNVISGNINDGVLLSGPQTTHNTLLTNRIGTGPAGTGIRPNKTNGVEISGGASSNTIGSGNVISGNLGNGVLITGSGTNDNTIQGAFIGTNSHDDLSLGNANNGVEISAGATNNLVTESVISGNGSGTVGDGVLITGAGTDLNIVSSCEIGTDLNGVDAIANAANGVEISAGATNTLIAANDIAGNRADGVLITGAGTSGTDITRCAIGDDLAGEESVPNGANGVEINGGATKTAISNNVISGNEEDGVLISGSSGNSVTGNAIGTNGSLSGALSNDGNGIELAAGATNNSIGGLSSRPGRVTGNLISGNGLNGVLITGSGTNNNLVQGNIIGADINGDHAIANGGNGVEVASGANANSIGGTAAAAGNVISFNHNDGILINTITNSTNTIEGNSIGTDPTERLAAGNQGNGIELMETSGQTIGGTVDGAGNIIAANGLPTATGFGVLITGATATNNELAGNYIGTNRQGNSSLGNLNIGVLITNGASSNKVGGTTEASRNVISGNHGVGVDIRGGGTSNNDVFRNYIGISPNGLRPLPNLRGVQIHNGARDNTVGAADDLGNVISGNQEYGVFITDGFGNSVSGNEIGLDATGRLMPTAAQSIGVGLVSVTAPAPSENVISLNTVSGNIQAGVLISDGLANTISGNTIGLDPAGNLISGSKQVVGVIVQSIIGTGAHLNQISDNTISGNQRAGVRLIGNTHGNTLTRNMIGVDFQGLAARPNGANGVAILSGASGNFIGSTEAGAGNVISANGANGVFIDGSNGNTIIGNDIGTVAGGTGGLGNAQNGVMIRAGASNNTIGGTTAATRNLISGNVANGVLVFGASSNTIAGNFIGTGVRGIGRLANGASGVSIVRGSSANVIGGTAAGAGNVISANRHNGVFISAANANQVVGNMIGTIVGATGALGNAEEGIVILDASNNSIGGTTAAARNIISGNVRNGVLISTAQSNMVSGNYIGTGIRGIGPLANGSGGVMIFAGSSDNTVGGASASARNVIAANDFDGILISQSHANTVSANWIGIGVTGLALGNGRNGVEINAGSNNNVIGGAIPLVDGTPMFGQGAGNVISSNGTGNIGDGVHIRGGSTGTAVLGNAIGTDPSGSQRRGNMANGVALIGSSGNTIGGTVTIGGERVTAGNLISSNGFNVANALPANATAGPVVGNGILMNGSNRNSIALDLVGVGLARVNGGSAYVGRLGNFNDGIAILNGRDNSVGATSPGGGVTVISGNGNLQSAAALYTLPHPAWPASSPNNVPQVNNEYLSNVWTLTANVFIGTGSSGNVIRNSYIGPNALGNDVTAGSQFVNGTGNGLPPITPGSAPFNPTQNRPSVTEDGVLLINASHNTIGPNNLISGNSLAGVQIVATGTHAASENTVAGNIVGLAKDGVTPLPNGFSTFTSRVNAFSSPVANDPRGTQFLINNARPGSLLTTYGAGIVIQGTGAANNTVGGTVVPLAGAPITLNTGNVISANWGSGVVVNGDPINQNGRVSNNVQSGASANVVEGNLIGTPAVNITGATSLLRGDTVANPLGNSQSGVFVQDSSNDRIVNNVISENQGSGVYLLDNSGFPRGRGLTVNIPLTGNSIGGDLMSNRPGVGLGNRFWGVVLDSGATVAGGSLNQNLIINNLNGPSFHTVLNRAFMRNYIPANYRPFLGDFPAASLVTPPAIRRLTWAGAAHQIIPA